MDNYFYCKFFVSRALEARMKQSPILSAICLRTENNPHIVSSYTVIGGSSLHIINRMNQ